MSFSWLMMTTLNQVLNMEGVEEETRTNLRLKIRLNFPDDLRPALKELVMFNVLMMLINFCFV